jgi:inosine/xanthosine triphosphatase
MKKVIVASKNEPKINATKIGFEKMFPGESFEFMGVSAPSGVADQPFTDRETYQGAYNRAANVQKEVPDADYWVGLEGGVEKMDADMHAFAWVVIRSKEKIGKSRTASVFLPAKVAELIDQGQELSKDNDIVFNKQGSGHSSGVVGVLTNDVIERAEYYSSAVILALIPFKNKDLY